MDGIHEITERATRPTEIIDTAKAIETLGYKRIESTPELEEKFRTEYQKNANQFLIPDYDGTILQTRRELRDIPTIPHTFVQKDDQTYIELSFGSLRCIIEATLEDPNRGGDPFPGFKVYEVLVDGKYGKTVRLFSSEEQTDRINLLSFYENLSHQIPANYTYSKKKEVQVCMPRKNDTIKLDRRGVPEVHSDSGPIEWDTEHLLIHLLHENAHASLDYRNGGMKDEVLADAYLIKQCQTINNAHPEQQFFDIPLLRDQCKVQLSEGHGVSNLKVNRRLIPPQT
jgi:hypothetical protein